MHKLLQLLRRKFNCCQGHLANLIGVSRPTFAKIEAGEVELTVSQAQKLAAAFRISLEDFLAGKESPTPQLIIEKEKTSAKNKKESTCALRISVPQKNMKKFKEVVLYILETVGAKLTVGEGVMCKLLYFIDFDYYEKYEEQFMGVCYIKHSCGPVPACFNHILKVMEEQEEIVAVINKHFQLKHKKYLPLRKANLALLSAQEKEQIDLVLAHLADKTAEELSKYVHRDVPLIKAENLKPIDYEDVFARTPEFSVRKYSEEKT